MSDYTRWLFRQQIDWFRRQFAQQTGLPFSQVLPAQLVVTALQSLGVRFYDSLYNPVTVLWLFLSQVMHANPTLAVTVECFLAWRLAQGMSPCSADTGAYARRDNAFPKPCWPCSPGTPAARPNTPRRANGDGSAGW